MNIEAKVLERSAVNSGSRIMDYLILMKPELTFLSVLSALCGFYLGSQGDFNWVLFFNVAMGTTLVGGGAGTLNQYIERSYDGMMKRTERRPLPSGRLLPKEVLIFGIIISIVGVLQLSLLVNLLTGALAFITWATYLFLYTPLKRVTPWSTFIGGIPGALPPVMGWTAVRNDITIEPIILFAILFCWQMPHFLSLAWMYRKDYARAGFKILSVIDETGERTSRQIVFYTIALIIVSIIPTYIGLTGSLSSISALLLGAAFISLGIALLRFSLLPVSESFAKVNTFARYMFFASLIYLPILMIMMSIDKV